jgi:hypothetical protein
MVTEKSFWDKKLPLFVESPIYGGQLFLGAKQEDLTIVHFLNKLIASCKEAVRVPF